MKKNIFFVCVFILAMISFGFHFPKENKDLKSFPSPNTVTATPIYTDNFNGTNDTASLKSRGYKIYNNSVPVGTNTFFQGSSSLFSAYNGSATGYVAANYSATGNVGNIDLWLIIPRISGGILAGDSLYFWNRGSTLGAATYTDSIRVMYSANGDSTASGTWIDLGRFKCPNPTAGAPNNGWSRFGFMAPNSGLNGRFAIRYNIVNGGISGANSNYIGIDALTIERIIAPPPSQWFSQSSGVTVSLNSISAPTNDVAWIAGNSGKVLKTTSGGIWTNASGNLPATTDMVNIWGIDASFALVTGTSATATNVYRTTNGGITWNSVFTQNGGHINSIGMKDINNGFISGNPVGGRWSLWKTTNGGLSWDSSGVRLTQTSSEFGYSNSMSVIGNNIWFGTNSSKVYYSSNYGANWLSQSTVQPENYSMWFNNSAMGLCGGNALQFTSNNGNVWTTQSSLGSGPISGLTGTGNVYWMTRVNNNFIYKTTDNGTTWQNDFNMTSSLNHISISRTGNIGGNVWAVSSTGNIYKYGVSDQILPVNSFVPDRFLLAQNYPNPFNPTTKINFALPHSSFITLKIYNSQGKIVSDLVNEYLLTGNYSLTFDGSALPSGIYYYHLSSENYNEAKKMILIK